MLPAQAFAGTTRFTGHRGPVYALCASARHRGFLSASGDGTVVRWKLDEPGQGTVIAKAGRAIFSMHRAQGPLLHLGDEDGGLHVVDLAARREVQLERAHVKGIFAMATLPDGRLVLAAGDGCISAWNTTGATATLQRKIPLSAEKIRALAVDPSGRLLAVACGDGAVRILDTTDLNERFTLPGHDKGANCLAWHPHKPALLSGGKDGQLRLWHTDAGFAPLHAFPAHKDTLYAIAFSPDGRTLATASRDKTAKLWSAADMAPLRRLDRHHGGHGYSVNALLWAGNGTLLTAGDDKAIVAWDLGTAE